MFKSFMKSRDEIALSCKHVQSKKYLKSNGFVMYKIVTENTGYRNLVLFDKSIGTITCPTCSSLTVWKNRVGQQ